MAFKEEWIGLQQRLVEAIEEETFPSGQEGSEEFRSYLRRYEESLPREWAAAPLEDLVSAAIRSRVIIVGDYHTNPYSSNMVLWLLENLDRFGRQPLIFLEALPNGFQKEIGTPVSAATLNTDLLTALGYHASFGFDWSLYHPILETAERIGASLFGINVRSPTTTLTVRDRFGASVVVGELKKAAAKNRTKEPVAVILVGEKHLAPPHLADALVDAFGETGAGSDLVHVHCNVPSLYFGLLSRGYSGAPALFKDSDQRFCALEVSPLALKSDDLNWFDREQTAWLAPDLGQAGPDRFPENGNGCERSFDEAGLFWNVLTELADILNCNAEGLEDFHFYTGEDFDIAKEIGQNGMNATALHSLLEEAQRARCVYIPEHRLAWIKEVNPAHLGKTAALHLAASQTGDTSFGSPLLKGVQTALGAALLDPYIAHESLIPRMHPSLRVPPRRRFAAADWREIEGFEVGLRIFRALIDEVITLDDVRNLFASPRNASAVIDRIIPKLKSIH